MELESETLGFEKDSSKQLSGFAIEDMELLESRPLDVGLLFGGLICKDKSGCAGNNSIFNTHKKPPLFSSPPPFPNYSSLSAFLVSSLLLLLSSSQYVLEL